MELNPRQLEAFRKVMVTGSMTLAAELLKISQPAVSRLIKDLEQELGIRLFRREGNRLIPGAEAQRLFREVDRFYRGMEQVARVAHDLKSVRIGTLRIASMNVLGLGLLCEAIAEFARVRPGVETSLDVRNTLGVLELAAANQIDIGFVHSMTQEAPGVNFVRFPLAPGVCVLPRGHRLARKKYIEVSDLQGEALISMPINNPMRMHLERALDAAGVTCRRPVETSLAYSACTLVASGLGLTVVDPYTAHQFPSDAVVRRPLVPDIPFEVAMVLPAHQPRSKVVDDFIAIVKGLFEIQRIAA